PRDPTPMMEAREMPATTQASPKAPAPAPPLPPMPEHESMTINGRLILKIGRNSCRGCGRSIEVFRHLHDERNDGLGDQRHHGRTVLWASPPECPGCDVQGQLARRHNPPRWGRLQRGIRREAVAAEADRKSTRLNSS